MESQLQHIQVNVAKDNLPFYKDLMAFLGWNEIVGNDDMLGTGGKNGVSLWFMGAANANANDYDGPGVNHLGIGVPSQADVDATVAYLKERNVESLFDTPRHRPDFSQDESSTYYQVMFESPDRVLFEVVYTGPKEK